MVSRKASRTKPKQHCHLSQWGKCIFGTQSRIKMRLLCVSMFVPINEQTLVLRKMMARKAFLKKPMHHCHLSHWGECVYGAQSWKERRLLHASMFVTIDGQTLIAKK